MDTQGRVAIIGIGCRFPGADGPGAFWRLLEQGVDAITEIPEDRPEFTELFDPDPKAPGRSYSRWGGFLKDVDQFDALFFGISPREAAHIDPQHRLLMETTWEASEDAGLPLPNLAGSNTGVFVGVSTHDYGDLQMFPQNRPNIGKHTNSGMAQSIAANRLSYLWDLRGPSIVVDTACSSALTAVHMACQSLLLGECATAFAGGAQLTLTPGPTIGFSKAAMLSKDGRCKAFDAEANGYVRSEGAGMVLLKPLAAAIADGDPIYAIIRATAVNQDGRTISMTVPSANAQQSLIQDALERAGIAPSDVQYVEAHGTGTPVGDPIEASAIGGALGPGRAADEPLAIGSVKTNIGHLEAASGIAGLIKVTLALKHRKIPASLHFHRANSAIDLKALRLRVVTELEAWPHPHKAAIAGVNSFGFGGANAHVLLEGWPGGAHTAASEELQPRLLAISAKSEESLANLAAAYSDCLRDERNAIRDICHSASERRAHLDYRVAIVATQRDEFLSRLSDFSSRSSNANIATGRAKRSAEPPLAFVFSGMGPQWWGMGRELKETEPVFRGALERCDALLRPYSGWSLLDEFARDEATSRVALPELAQVTNFALQVALTELWASYGIKPAAVIGHSGGAMAAFWVAGVYGLEDALRLAFYRSRLQGRPSNQGKMLAVGVPYEEIVPMLEGESGRISLAAVNGPSTITLSGEAGAIERLAQQLQERRIFARILGVNIAYHSPVMEQIREEFLEEAEYLRGRSASIPLVSDTTGTWADGEECDAEYWWRAIRQPVLFRDGIGAILERGIENCLEIGPHPVLSAAILECMRAAGVQGTAVPTLRRSENERLILLRSLGSLYTLGRNPQWSALREPSARLVEVPTYPWNRKRHWLESSESPGGWHETAASQHPLLGSPLGTARPAWENRAGDGPTGFLKDHQVQGSAIFPGAGYVEMALAACRLSSGQVQALLQDVEFLRPMVLNSGGATPLQLALDSDKGQFEVFSSPGGEAGSWIVHARGAVGKMSSVEMPAVDAEALRGRISNPLDPETFYRGLTARGLHLGAAFQGVSSLLTGPGEALGVIQNPQVASADGYQVHPALLDAGFQVLVAAADSDPLLTTQTRLFLPVKISEVRFWAEPGNRFLSHARLVEVKGSTVTGDVRLFREDGTLCVEIRGLMARMIDSSARAREESIDNWLYDYRWEPFALQNNAARAQFPAAIDDLRTMAHSKSLEFGWQEYYSTVEGRLGEIAAAYAFEAFIQSVEKGRLSPETIAASGWRRSLAEQLLENLELAGLVRRDGEVWQTTGAVPSAKAAALAGDFLREFPQHSLDVGLLERCGPRLGEVLSGRVDGTEVLFSGDGFQFLERFYRGSPAQFFYNNVVSDVVTACGGEALRVLEVGGGTAGTTSHLLPKLGSACESYVFTDVSPLFLERARAKFSTHENFSTKLFDLTKDPAAQGIEPASFDLILAANVLHATKDVEVSTNRLRPLLAPGGVLVLLEITRHPRWLDIVFGLTEGWWKFEDRQRRPSYPLMSGAGWTGLLGECGMEQAAIVADQAPGEPGQSVVIARRPLADLQHAAQHWLLLADRKGVASRLADALKARGCHCDLLSAATADLAALGSDSSRLTNLHGVLYLGGIDSPKLDESTLLEPASFDASAASGCNGALAALQCLFQGTPLAERKIVLVTAGACAIGGDVPDLLQAPLWGVGRVVCKEWPNLQCQMVDLSAAATDEELAALAGEILRADEPSAAREEELAFRGSQRFVHRLRRTTLTAMEQDELSVVAGPDDAWRAEMVTARSLEHIVLRRCERPAVGPMEVEVAVEKAGLNFRDVMLSLGVVSGLELENSFGGGRLGADFAGTITRCGESVRHLRPGDQVLGIAAGTFASHAITHSHLVACRPENLSAQEAATIPAAYITARYALRDLARLARGETILIHAASGGVGLAAIQMARRAGAQVFATAGSPVKRAYLESLGVSHVMDSRTTSFAAEILELTAGRGVDVILNSLAGAAIEKGISALAPYGRFVEIGKADIYQNHRLDMGPFRRNLSLFALDLDQMCQERPAFVGNLLQEVADDLRSGVLTPPPQIEFPMTDLSSAMKFMAQAKHIGKIVLTNHENTEVRRAIPDRAPVRGDGTYLITGGMGGLGLRITRWLLEQGARSIVLMGRNPASLEIEAQLQEMRHGDIRVEAVAADVSIPRDVERVVQGIRQNLPPLRGLIHAAMVLEDTPLDALRPDAMERVMKPKAAGAWNLHAATKSDPLDFFVCFSSITSLLGNAQQANYAAANCFLDALGPFRRARGLPATTINWGVISGAGYVARHREVQDYLDRQGYLSLNEEQLLAAFDSLLRYAPPQIMAARIDWTKLAEQWPRVAASPRIRHLPAAGKGTVAHAASSSILQQLESDDPGQRASHLETYMRDQVARLLGASASTIDIERPISDMGLDSLIAVELTVILERDLHVEFPNTGLIGASVRGLCQDLLRLLSFNVSPADTPPSRSQADGIPEMAADDQETIVAAPAGIAAPLAEPEPFLPSIPLAGVTRTKELTGSTSNGHSLDYSALDYSDWSPAQRTIRMAVKAGFGALGKIETRGLENIPSEGGCLLAVNHLSMADVPLLLTRLSRRAIILANDRLKQNGIIDWFISDMGQAIYVSRDHADADSLERALTVLRSGGLIALAPEGTRSRNGELLRGKTGVAWLATQTGVPVVPLAAWGQEYWRDRWKRLRRIPIQVNAGPPIQLPKGAASPAQLRQYTDRIMSGIAALLPQQYRGVYGVSAFEDTVTTKDVW